MRASDNHGTRKPKEKLGMVFATIYVYEKMMSYAKAAWFYEVNVCIVAVYSLDASSAIFM